jgi:excisionase family DNA binding protein
VSGTEELDQLLSPQDLAEYLGVPLGTLYHWRTQGNGPPGLRVGRFLRYRRSDVEAWIRDRVTRDDTAPPWWATPSRGR